MSKISPMIAVGQVIKKTVVKEVAVARVRYQQMILDKNLYMYFPKKIDKYAIDMGDETRVGDLVVIKNLDEKFGKKVTCTVDSVLYKSGAVIDPVTGRPCRGTEFIEEAERKVEQSRRTVETLKRDRTVEVKASETT